MSEPELRAEAERRFDAAIAASPARDPRDYYRERLKLLRSADAGLYQRAVTYYEQSLLPAVAAPDSDPVAEWLDYGRFVAGLATPGRTVQIDRTGLAGEFDRTNAAGELILHIPSASREPVLVIGLPRELSTAQRATYELLVRRPVD